MWRICSSSVDLIFATRRCGCGGTVLGRCLQPTSSGNVSRACGGIVTGAGTSTRCSSGSTASVITCGAQLIKRALKRHGSAEKMVTDGLRSYPAAMRELGILDRREMGRWKNNRVENSHLPFRRRERAILRFRRMKTLQKFVSVHASVPNHFNHERHVVDRQNYKTRRSAALAEWQSLAA